VPHGSIPRAVVMRVRNGVYACIEESEIFKVSAFR
jgi:hypothetical protein